MNRIDLEDPSASTETQKPVVLIGRQPILDRKMQLYGYELLYRSSSDNFASISNGDAATIDVLINTFSQAGLKSIVGNKIAFINITTNFFAGQYLVELPVDWTILEISDLVQMDSRMQISMQRLSTIGYKFAMDGISTIEQAESLDASFKYAKVDISKTGAEDLPIIAQILLARNVTLIAEKVETMEQFRTCIGLEFHFFQGYFFCKPEVLPVRKVETSRMILLQAISQLLKPDVILSELSRIISMDPGLGYRLLKLVNSGFYTFSTNITSIHHAISLLGINQLKRWMSLFLITGAEDKPNELSNTAMIRAKAAEAYSKELKFTNSDSYFLAGLFSVLDAMLDTPMKEIVNGLQLSADIETALVDRKGNIGKMLLGIQAMEEGIWAPILELGMDPERINEIWMETIDWTEKLQTEVAVVKN